MSDLESIVQGMLNDETTVPTPEDNVVPEPTPVDNSNDTTPSETVAASETISDDTTIQTKFGDVDKDKIKNYIKKTVGDVELKDLTEREIKALKNGFHAEHQAFEKSNRLSEFERQQKEQQLTTQKAEIDQNDKWLEEQYNNEHQKLIDFKAQALQQKTAELASAGMDADYIAREVGQYNKQLDQQYAQFKQQLDQYHQQTKTQHQTARNTYQEQMKEKSFSTVESKLKDDFDKEPELKQLFNEFKNKYGAADEFESFVVPAFKKILAARDERLAKTAGTNKAKQTNSTKQTVPSTSNTDFKFDLSSDKSIEDLIRIKL